MPRKPKPKPKANTDVQTDDIPDMANLQQKLDEARAYVTAKPWNMHQDMLLFSYLIMAAKISIVKETHNETKEYFAYSDQENIYIFDTVVRLCAIDELAMIILHEILHNCKDDIERIRFLPDGDALLFNYASDLFINTWLHAQGLPLTVTLKSQVTLPNVTSEIRWLLNGSIMEYTTEQVYELLKQHQVEVKRVCGLSNRAKHLLIPHDSTKWKDIFSQAYNLQKNIGQTPSAHFEQAIKEQYTPKIKWHLLLNKAMRAIIPTDYSILNPDLVMYVNHNLWLPDVSGQEYKVIFAIDISGSITRRELVSAITEVNNLLQKYNADILLITADTEIVSITTLSNMPVTHIPTIGGGTDFRSVIEYVIENYNTSKYVALIYFTDGLGTFPSKATVAQLRMPLIWLITTDKIAPVGQTIKYEMEKEKQ